MILFRCDASSRLGVGHLARCRTLAGALVERGLDCAMVGPPDAYRTEADRRIFRDWVPMPFGRTPREDARAFVALMAERTARFAVVDDYRVDEDYQDELRRGAVRWLQFNRDPARPLWADLVLDPSPEPVEADYRQSLRNPDTRLLLGPRFALLRPEFAAGERTRAADGSRRVLVTFGGGDDRGGILAVLEALLPGLAEDVRFLVVSGKHNPANPGIADWIASRGRDRVDLQVNPPRVAPLIASCDLAIMAGGGTVFEVNRYAIPMVLIAIADNQVDHSRAWERLGAASYLGRLEALDPRNLLSAAKSALAAAAGAGDDSPVPRLVDGQGRIRVADAIIGAIG